MADYFTNEANFIGTITEDITPDLLYGGKILYKTSLSVCRRSGTVDNFTILADKEMFEQANIRKGSRVCVYGEIQTRNEYDAKRKRHLIVYVRVIEIHKVHKLVMDENRVILAGALCIPVEVRITKTGKRSGNFVLYAIDTIGNRSVFIPCVAWNENAIQLCGLRKWERISFEGRMQSRDYIKRLESGEKLHKTAFEVSVMSLI